MLRDNSEVVAHAVTFPPQSLGTAVITGSAVDTKGYDSASFVFSAGTSDGTGTVSIAVQESTTGTSAWTATGTVQYLRATHGTASYVVWEPVGGAARYVRAVATPSGSGTAIAAGTFCLGDPKTAPVT